MSVFSYSFEFFPPRSPAAENDLWNSITELKAHAPKFVTVTYGAGGSSRQGSLDVLDRLLKETPWRASGHLACAGASKSDCNEVAKAMWQRGVRHIIAIRGDLPQPGPYTPHPEGYAYTTDLIAGLRQVHPFEISVACYPEKHPDAPSLDADLAILKRKFQAGADRAISQFFYEADTFLRFRDKAVAQGIFNPIVPGILPPVNFVQTKKFAGQCQASIPAKLEKLMEGADDASRSKIAADYCIELCDNLLREGVRHFHFYTLNKAATVGSILKALNGTAAAHEPRKISA